MLRTLRESKAKLSELVELASQGEDVLITVRGRVRARLTSVETPDPAASSSRWLRELRALHRAYGMARLRTSSDQILAGIREDRF